MLTSACKTDHIFKKHFQAAASYRKTLVLESLFNSEYCEIFKSTFFEKHMRTAASENVFMKLRKTKIYPYGVFFYLTLKHRFFQHQYQKQVKMSFLFHDWFPISLYSHKIFLWCGEK